MIVRKFGIYNLLCFFFRVEMLKIEKEKYRKYVRYKEIV